MTPTPNLMAGRRPGEPAPPTAPRRLQQRRTAGWRKPPDAVAVGRNSRWGNPYRLDQYGREEAVARYEADLLADPARVAQVREHLAGRDLMCWCPLDQPCHGAVLLRVANDWGTNT